MEYTKDKLINIRVGTPTKLSFLNDDGERQGEFVRADEQGMVLADAPTGQEQFYPYDSIVEIAVRVIQPADPHEMADPASIGRGVRDLKARGTGRAQATDDEPDWSTLVDKPFTGLLPEGFLATPDYGHIYITEPSGESNPNVTRST